VAVAGGGVSVAGRGVRVRRGVGVGSGGFGATSVATSGNTAVNALQPDRKVIKTAVMSGNVRILAF
jgi:hypothetical protein